MTMIYHCERLTKKIKHTLRKAAAVQDPPAEVPLAILTRSQEAEARIIQHFECFNLSLYMNLSRQNRKEPKILRGQTY